jgi:glycosyltransferase involved in cell wall biosynthesis
VTPDAAGEAGCSSVRLLVYSDAPVWGGAEECVASILEGLDGGFEAVVVGIDREIATRIAERRPGSRVQIVRPVRGVRDVRALVALVRVFRRLKPDVVHVNMRGPYLTQHGELAATLSGLPTVALEHSVYLSDTRRRRLLKRFTTRRLAAHVAPSEASARYLERHTPALAGSIATIRNGVWPREVTPLRVADGPVIGSVGRIAVEKGYDYLVDALPQLPSVTCVIVGAGSHGDALRAHAERLGVSERLVLTGWVADSREYLAGFDVFVLPSLTEGFPLTTLEAMQLGVPVVATDVGGVSEQVVDGDTGLLVPPADPSALARAIGRLLDDAELRERVTAGGRTSTAEAFAGSTMASAWGRLYRSLVRSATSP